MAAGRYLACEDDGAVLLLGLEASVTRIGRSPAADVELEVPTVSRRHALIVIRDQTAVLLDDGLDGTWLNGRRVAKAVLVHTT